MGTSTNSVSPSEAARRLGVSAKALRLYEERGLVRPTRTSAGWRAYGPDQLAQAAQVVSLRALGFSLSQVAKVLESVADGLEPMLRTHEASLEGELGRMELTLNKVRGLRRDLAQSAAPTAGELAGLAHLSSEPLAAFDLPWPWASERFEVREVRSLNYIIGPLGSGKTRLAMAIAEHLPEASFLGLDRAPAPLGQDGEAALTRLVDDGATVNDALIALVAGLVRGARKILVVDMIEQGLDEASQTAVIAYLRRRPPDRSPLFLLTRSSAILDLAAVTTDETVIFCPANHGPPFRVPMRPGAAGYEAMSSCLGSPAVRARTDGMIAWMPHAGDIPLAPTSADRQPRP